MEGIIVGGKRMAKGELEALRLPVDRDLWERAIEAIEEQGARICLLMDLVHFIATETQIELREEDGEYYWGDGFKIQIPFDHHQAKLLAEIFEEYSDEQ
jgi:hypothetical protein